MLVVRSFDYLHAAISEVNADGVDNGRIFATAMLAGQVLPSVLAFFPRHDASKYQAFVYFPIAFVLACIYVYLRRRQIQTVRAALPRPVPMRARLIAALFLFIGTTGSLLGAQYSPLAAVSVLLVVACLPWQDWALPQGAP